MFFLSAFIIVLRQLIESLFQRRQKLKFEMGKELEQVVREIFTPARVKYPTRPVVVKCSRKSLEKSVHIFSINLFSCKQREMISVSWICVKWRAWQRKTIRRNWFDFCERFHQVRPCSAFGRQKKLDSYESCRKDVWLSRAIAGSAHAAVSGR